MSEKFDALNLPEDRLTTADKLGRRLFLHPAEVRGRYHNRRNIVHTILILIFLVLPWISINGRPVVLLDIAARKFVLFGEIFWSHDAPKLVFLLMALGFGIGLLTAIKGRLWCGWGCPQTVFVDAVYRRIEGLVIGHAFKRRKLQAAPWNFEKIWRFGLTWFLFFCVSFVLTHSFLAYFVGKDRVFEMMSSSPTENWEAFLIAVISTALVIFDFGWFREQFCTIICPYGRFQSVLMDTHSLAILYDAKRGEPRKGIAAEGGPSGDCVACYRCVQVCPTGIDIRRGVQMECVACSACIDACDEIMTKLKRPTGLIKYSSEVEMAGGEKQDFRVRSGFYLVGLILAIGGLFFALVMRSNLDVRFIRAIETPYQVVTNDKGEKEVINHFRVAVSNHTDSEYKFTTILPPQPETVGVQLISAMKEYVVPGGTNLRVDIFIRFPVAKLQKGLGKIPVKVDAVATDATVSKDGELSIVGPIN